MKIKEFNKNVLLFVICAIFIVIGLSSFSSVLLPVTSSVFSFMKNEISFNETIETINNTLDKKLTYHAQLMDLNSLKDNLLGTKVIKKDETIIVKSDSGNLMDQKNKINKEDIHNIVSEIKKLQNVCENNDADFLYCAAPKKELYETAPVNVDNFFKDNYNYFLRNLNEKNIPYIDFSELLIKNGIPETEMFYITDHHWKSYCGFVATDIICENLEKKYNFTYDKNLTDIKNYTIRNYPDWFLGSFGKKTGAYFTSVGVDDFDLITPKFDTNLIDEQPFKNQIRKGKFEDSVLYLKNMEKDYYNVNPYATYGGGDFRLQIIKNNLNPNGKKILLIRDSFASVVAPFLSLQTSELHICDMRNYEYYVGEKLNAADYIKEIKPDYVLVLYSGITSLEESYGRYDFFDYSITH